jgi:SAM-dependent methyltransferase
MHETSKTISRRLHDARFATRYFVGDGIDIGSGPDPLAQYHEFFPLMKSCRAWDLKDGDAQLMAGVADASFNFVHSSHCLEHLRDPREALAHWLRILKPGGHLVCVVPDEDLYEQGVFPSTFNADHKHTFTLHKRKSWSPVSVNLFDLLQGLEPASRVLRIELLDATYRYRLAAQPGKRIDQTMTPVGECAIEFVVQRMA